MCGHKPEQPVLSGSNPIVLSFLSVQSNTCPIKVIVSVHVHLCSSLASHHYLQPNRNLIIRCILSYPPVDRIGPTEVMQSTIRSLCCIEFIFSFCLRLYPISSDYQIMAMNQHKSETYFFSPPQLRNTYCLQHTKSFFERFEELQRVNAL